jgi:hypothetical protein
MPPGAPDYASPGRALQQPPRPACSAPAAVFRTRDQHSAATSVPEAGQALYEAPGRPGRLCLLDPQVAQQPVERLLVGVVLLPTGGAYEKSRRPSSITTKAAAMAESDHFVPKPAGPLSALGIIRQTSSTKETAGRDGGRPLLASGAAVRYVGRDGKRPQRRGQETDGRIPIVLTRSLAAVLLFPVFSLSAAEQFELNCIVKWKGGVVDDRWVVPEPTKLHFKIDRQKGTVYGQSGNVGSFSEDEIKMTMLFKGRYYNTGFDVIIETGEMTYLIQSALSNELRPQQTGTCEMPIPSGKPNS